MPLNEDADTYPRQLITLSQLVRVNFENFMISQEYYKISVVSAFVCLLICTDFEAFH